MSSKHAGSTLTLNKVVYRHLALVVTRCSTCGRVKVLLGSTSLGTFSLQASSTQHRYVLVVSSSTLTRSGALTLKQVSGGKPVTIEGVGVSLSDS